MGIKLVDQYTYLHFATGIISYFFGIPLILWFVLHTIFELTENTSFGMYLINTYFKFWPGGKPKSDSIINIIGDTIGTLLGWISAYGIDKVGNYYKLYNLHIKN